MKTRVLTELHIEAPVETVYAFLVDMENTNRLKSSLMGGTVQMVEKTPDSPVASHREDPRVRQPSRRPDR